MGLFGNSDKKKRSNKENLERERSRQLENEYWYEDDDNK